MSPNHDHDPIPTPPGPVPQTADQHLAHCGTVGCGGGSDDDSEPVVVLDGDDHDLAVPLPPLPGPTAVTAIPAPAPAPAITLPLLRDLHALSVRQLGSRDGQIALAVAGLDHPDLISAYRPGFLPAALGELLPTEAQSAIAGRDLAGRIILPALDERGVIVDMFALGGPPSLHDAPRGLLAPVLATACADLVVTTDAARVGPSFQAGRPCLLLRNAADVVANVERLRAGGVRAVTIDATGEDKAALATALAGLAAVAAPVTPALAVQPTDALTLVSHDERAERATFTAGLLTIDAQVPHRGRTRIDLCLTANGASDRQTLDVAVTTQRLRCARTAGLKLRVPAGSIAVALEALGPALSALANPVPAAAPVPAPDEVPSVLRDPALLDRLLDDCAALGWTGEYRAVVLLSALSRLAAEPVWTVLTATTPGERFPALDALLRLTPPEALLHASRLSDNALVHLDGDALHHRLLVLDEATAVAPAVATALGILRARGSLTGTEVQRDGIAGRMRTRSRTLPGPLAVVTATASTIPASLRRHLVEVPVETGASTAAAAFLARHQRLTAPAADPSAILARLHAAQRALRPLPVILPALGEVPADIRQHRGLHDAFFGLVTASALLHQHQRPRCDGHVAATAADIALAVRLLTPLVPIQVEGLTLRAQQVRAAIYAAIHATGSRSFTLADVAGWLPEWSPATRWRAVADLIEVDVVVAVAGRQGARRSYEWVGPTPLPILAADGGTAATSTEPATGSAEVACG